MIFRIIFVVGVSLGMCGASDAAEQVDRVQDLIICKSPARIRTVVAGKSTATRRAVRTLRAYETVEKTETGTSSEGCRATYSKTNVERVVGTSRQMEYCQSILSGIQKNLEASKWSCRHVGAMNVLKSGAVEASEAAAASTVE